MSTENAAWQVRDRTQMRAYLDTAARRLGVTLTGDVMEGRDLRSISSAADGHPGGPGWLRVGREHIRWITDPGVGDFWTGIPDAGALVDVPAPRVLASLDLGDDPDGKRRVRADLVTRLPGAALSHTEALHTAPGLPASWWADLRAALDRLRAHPTTRRSGRRATAGRRLREVFGDQTVAAYPITAWETAHGDLHYANLLGPDLGILDWELWGQQPAGADAATLYLYALLVPDVAATVRDAFADVLGSPAGRVAQLHVASRILQPTERGGNPDLADVVRHHIDPLIHLPRPA